MKTKWIILFTALACLVSCGGEPSLDMIGMIDGQSPGANQRFAGTGGGMMQGLGHTLVNSPEVDYKVYVGTDMHIDSNSGTAHTGAFFKAYTEDDSAPMALILGDLVDGKYSMKTASEKVRELAGAKVGTTFLALGNHDIYFQLWKEWAAEWGKSNYTVQVRTPEGTDLYICLDSASGHLGSSQMAWLKEVLEDAGGNSYRHIIVFTHTHMFKKDDAQGHTSNYPLEETWELTSLFQRYGVELFISGHCHSRDISHFNGVEYVVVDALDEHSPDSKTGYMTLEAGKDLECKFFRFDGK